MCGFGLNTGSLSLLVLLQQTKFGGFIENLVLYSSDGVVSDGGDVGVKMAFCCFVLGLGRRAGLLSQALVCTGLEVREQCLGRFSPTIWILETLLCWPLSFNT